MRGSKLRTGIGRLEVLLALAGLALVLQFFGPQLWAGLLWVGAGALWAVDVRNWSRATWFLVNLAIVVILVGIRFGPGWKESWAESKESSAVRRSEDAEKKERKRRREQEAERKKRGETRIRRY